MKPASLSLRIGLWVGMLGSVLIALLLTLAYLALDHQLDLRAHRELEDKLGQLRHALEADPGLAALPLRGHALQDQLMGHDNLSAALLDEQRGRPAQFSSGPNADLPILDGFAGNGRAFGWTAPDGRRLLTERSLIRLRDGNSLRVFLTLDRRDDDALLGAFLRSAWLAVPPLLLLIALGARLVAKRGLLPLRQFGQVASRVTTQDLSHRIPLQDLPRELGKAARALNLMLHRLDDGVQQLTQFSDDIAHELRSPIGNLLGKAQVTLSRPREKEEYETVLAASTEELERVGRIVSDMLFLAQVSHPRALLPQEPVRLEEEAAKVAELFDFSAEEKSLSIVIEGHGRVVGDRLMIQRAISNLLSNAIRHTPGGERISVQVRDDGEAVTLQVQNPGAGIAAEHLEHLFERFYRVDKGRSRAQGGTGLGLAIVRSIMELHLGSASAQSAEEGPTRFLLTFPSSPD
ncbi:heavy metal sensor histidine kinase [Pseudomonas sp. PDM23]|uniref:heavy metal sensor histidine kinase n=1 Tax=unclassified Pseudomonas TaxID=196821 RepID=UPI00177D55DD|nr:MULTISPECIES: heavy metal sensor histidine kinase [unclassified Pseudomonas]MBD9578926.1 heavy metal sensor histidine kinase [Pseudomonas sp. PDM23]MBD9674554.1 heavy metal sensor histidine kinase [Pseudomonas sp. PDM21]